MKNRAFTLIEMLWVLAIIAILLSISTIAIRHSQAKARDVVRKSDLQMIADALISYGNDHGHFPSSIYDNWQQAIQISQALNMISDWWYYKASWLEMLFYPDEQILTDILWITTFDSENFETSTIWASDVWTMGWNESKQIYRLKDSVKINDNFETISSIIENAENEAPIATNLTGWKRIMNYSIVTQWMCAASLKKYLVDEWYISAIPTDPSGVNINLQTNICAKPWNFQGWVNANETWWSIQETDCFANTNFWCTQICKEGYVYVSDWEHFALIAHMESENWWNYETTSCWLSCEIAWSCSHTNQNDKEIRTKTDQLPCDITDEFTNSFDCIQNTWVVEYNTWEYYFYIY
jgi:prepilin-type N-terminal cleavage/methylation domain-containing protein